MQPEVSAGLRPAAPRLVATIAFAAGSVANPSTDKYAVKVPGGLAFSEFKGYESWQVVSASHKQNRLP